MDFLPVLLDFILDSLDLLLGWYFVEKISLKFNLSIVREMVSRLDRKGDSIQRYIYICVVLRGGPRIEE